MHAIIFKPEIHHWILLSLLLFSIGLYGMLSRPNVVGILISLELMLNSAALNFILFNAFVAAHKVDGSVMAIFIVAVAAAEVVVAMAILVALYKARKTVDVNKWNVLRER
jgi:NADH-quinone oxidoreductase subunit K